MKFVWIILSLLTMLYAEEKSFIHSGYVLEGTPVTLSSDLKLGYQFLSKRFGTRYNFVTDTNFYNNANEAIEAFKQGTINYIAMPLAIFAPHHEELLPYTALVFLTGNGDEILQSFVTLSRVSDSSDIRDYTGKVAVHEANNANSDVYMDTLAFSTVKKRANELFSIQTAPNSQRAILMVFFSKADIACVPMSSWETAKAMNPALGQKLKIIDQSPKALGYGIELYHKNLSKTALNKAVQMNEDIHSSEDGKQLLRIMKAHKRQQIEPKQISSYIAYYVRYADLANHHFTKQQPLNRKRTGE